MINMRSESIIFIFFSLIICSFGQHDLGSSCFDEFTKSNKTYKLLMECPSVMDNVKHPIRCAPVLANGTEIVCCPEVSPTINIIRKAPIKNYFSSISEKMCYKYKSDILEDDFSLSSLEKVHSMVQVDKCESQPIPLIPSSSTSRKNYPHMAFLGYITQSGKLLWLCDGILISDEWILAPAHCSQSKYGGPKRVRLGELHGNIEDYSYKDNYLIANHVTHPEYNRSTYNDIVLYQLLPKVKLTPLKRPACLPSTIYDSVESKAIFTGVHQDNKTGKIRTYLKQKTVEILSTKYCNDLYSSRINQQLLEQGIMSETQICASSIDSKINYKDLDGVLQVYHPEQKCMFIVIGIASFGLTQPPEDPENPGLYTRLFPYVEWIERVVWKNDDLMYISDIRR